MVFYFARTKLNSEKEGVEWQESLGDGDSYLQGGTLYHATKQGVAVMRRNRACRSQFSFQLNFAGPLFFPRPPFHSLAHRGRSPSEPFACHKYFAGPLIFLRPLFTASTISGDRHPST